VSDESIRAAYHHAEDGLFQAEVAFFEANARRSAIDAGAGLHYRPLDPDARSYVVAYNGQLVGQIRPRRPGQVLLHWSAYDPDGVALPATYLTARAAPPLSPSRPFVNQPGGIPRLRER
jgi:hypothetical protein